jgi:nucleotide-binding universal stress UspA family protein
MRVLVAYDGSAGAEQAVALAGALQWPADSRLTVAGVVERPIQRLGLPGGMTSTPEIDALIREHHHEGVSGAARRLSAGGLQAEGVVLDGRPATTLLEEAARVRADLIIAGSRGRGRVASLVLGSVSAELVDNAPCPVLVARTGRVSRIVLAVDDSVPAAAAESLVAGWAIFEGLPIQVLVMSVPARAATAFVEPREPRIDVTRSW